jgi:hypothetical protein
MKNCPEERTRSKREKHEQCEKPRMCELISFRKETKRANASSKQENTEE